MKRKRTHTGIYSCPDCCLEFDLENETNLKCDECDSALKEGSLEDQDEDEDGDDD